MKIHIKNYNIMPNGCLMLMLALISTYIGLIFALVLVLILVLILTLTLLSFCMRYVICEMRTFYLF